MKYDRYFIIYRYVTDDLFDDEDDAPKKVAKDAPPRKEKYLDQKWKLADEDAKEFDGEGNFIILVYLALLSINVIIKRI